MRVSRVAMSMAVALAIALVGCSGSEDPGGSDGAEAQGPGWTRVSPTELDQMLHDEDVYLVNVHVPDEGDIPGTDAKIPYTEIATRVDEVPTDGEPKLVLYCRSGDMSTEAAQDLVDVGVTGFYELEGGFIAWNDAGLPFDAP